MDDLSDRVAGIEKEGSSRPLFSLVIPAYNEKARIRTSIDRIAQFLSGWEGGDWEVIVVDDGSTDGTGEALGDPSIRARLAGGDGADDRPRPRVTFRVLQNSSNRGKGYATRRGVLASQGEIVLLSDADLSTPLGECERLIRWLERGNEVAIGSRGLGTSRILVRQAWYRQSMGRVFNLFVRLFLLPDFRDTQCGFKAYRGAVAREVFRPPSLRGFAFDVEILVRAVRHGHRVAEVPVTWSDAAGTRVHILRDSLSMFADLVKVKVKDARGVYSRRAARTARAENPPPDG
jgi:dolichyl-phosphate beta-glucosyltransferase